MKKLLFFDDNKLFGIENTVRRYGNVKQIANYNDGICSTDFCTGRVFKLDDGRYRMLYFGHSADFDGKKLFCAESNDGINFKPERLFDIAQHPEKCAPHEVMSLSARQEIAFIYEDEHCHNPSERYKLLLSSLSIERLAVESFICTSPDLINWKTEKYGYRSDGPEPLLSIFYNKEKKHHTFIERPSWGIRSVGFRNTKDFVEFSEFKPCLNVDSSDERLAEIYGMFAFEYDGMYIGLPHIYRGLKSELNAKYKNGIIDTQLAYSADGEYWQRSLREPFISGVCGKTDKEYKLMWCFDMQKREDSIYFYASASEREHGPAFHEPGKGSIIVYVMRKDGFVSLCTLDKTAPSVVSTRECAWFSGEPSFNLKAKKATVAVYISDESEFVSGNTLGVARPLEGFSHDDCIPFEGDSTSWTPKFKSGRCVEELSGKTIILEVRFCDGELYSICGDFTLLYNTEAAKYRKFGALPERK